MQRQQRRDVASQKNDSANTTPQTVYFNFHWRAASGCGAHSPAKDGGDGGGTADDVDSARRAHACKCDAPLRISKLGVHATSRNEIDVEFAF